MKRMSVSCVGTCSHCGVQRFWLSDTSSLQLDDGRLVCLRHPDLFDEGDLANKQTTKYCAEWYAAILLKQKRQMLSLVSKYDHHGYKKYPRKQEVLRRCLTPEQHRYVIASKKSIWGTGKGIAGMPDLFVYKPDYSECFFCEAKGPDDDLSASQRMVFDRFESRTGIPVYVFSFYAIR